MKVGIQQGKLIRILSM